MTPKMSPGTLQGATKTRPKTKRKMLEKKAGKPEEEGQKLGMYKRRNARVFDDGI